MDSHSFAQSRWKSVGGLWLFCKLWFVGGLARLAKVPNVRGGFCISPHELFRNTNWLSYRPRRPNGPELSCGNEVPQRRNPVRARRVMSDSSWLFRACKIVDGRFRQLERLVRWQSQLVNLHRASY